jgi:predicted DNA-binding transcriptional regulator YafY
VRRRGGELHLVAHCELRGAQRTFKLDRVVHLTRIEDTPVMTAPAAEPVAIATPVLDNTPVVP